MTANTIERLEWDSQFFGYSVAKVGLDDKGYDKVDVVFRQLASDNIRLTYFFIPMSETKLNNYISERGGKLVDQKTIFFKKTEGQKNFCNNIIEYQGTEINDRLIALGLQAGLFSRFRLDINFTKNEYKRLYIEWLTKSLNKTLAINTFIAKNGPEIIGITTLGKRSGFADIGLVAVDEKFRGKGIASDLIHFAENTAFNLGFNEIKVATQLHNKGACRLYEKTNFQIESITNIYHYWQ